MSVYANPELSSNSLLVDAATVLVATNTAVAAPEPARSLVVVVVASVQLTLALDTPPATLHVATKASAAVAVITEAAVAASPAPLSADMMLVRPEARRPRAAGSGATP